MHLLAKPQTSSQIDKKVCYHSLTLVSLLSTSHQLNFSLTRSTTHIKLPSHAPTILSNNGIPIQHTNANIKPCSVTIFKEK
jgi:hypothetical protein